jgi:hypothetical protein
MNEHNRYLRIALVVVGIAFLLLYPLTKIWASGWVWQPDQSESLHMIIGVYATLGIFLLWASRKPEDHRSLIWFTIWSSAVHGLIMAVQAAIDPAERGHLVGDVPAMILVAIVLSFLASRKVMPAHE